MAYTDGGYANVTQVISDLKYLGISKVRDGITNGVDPNGNPNGSAPLSTYIAMAQAGIKFTFIIEATSEAVIQTQLALINQVETAVPGSILAVEGPNEVSNFPITFNGLTGQAAATAAQQALYAAVKADVTLAGVKVDYFTGYASGSTDPTTTPGLADDDNQHPYPNFDEAPAFWVSRAQALSNLGSADVATAPAVYTETGYSSNSVPLDVQAKYTLDLLMDTAKDGISQTYLYDLLDAYAPGSVQGDDGFGLFNYTGAAKPVATAIHDLTALLQDTGANATTFTPATLSYSFSNLPANGNSLLMEKSNGTYVLVIWAEPEIYSNTTNSEIAAPSENVTVTLPKSFASIQVFDPLTGTTALASYSNASSVTVAVTDHPIVIELGGAAVTSAPPVLTITAPKQIAGTKQVALSGTVTDISQTNVVISDHGKVLGNAVVSNGSWSFTSASLATGSHLFSATATDANGNTATAADPAFSVSAPTLTIVYNAGIDTSTTTRTGSNTHPITIASSGSDKITLAIAEDAYLGDAEFTVTVDGKQIGGVQTATALHGQGLSQNFTLLGNFGAGPHTVAVDFLNDAAAIYSNGALAGDRNLYVDSITGDEVTTVENVEQNLAGTVNYTIILPATVVKPTQLAPVVTLATAQSAAVGGTATLGTAVAGNSGDALVVKLVSDADFSAGSSLALSNNSLIYKPGAITAGNAGTDTISYTVTDSTNGLATTETQKITLVAPVVKPTVSIISQVLAQDTGASSTDDITSNGAVTLTGAVTGAAGTVVSIIDGSTTLGTATISNGQWTYSTTLAAGTHTLHAVATDPAGDVVTTSAEPTITVVAAPLVTINNPVEVTGTTAVALSGTVTDATQTSVQIIDASGVLGNATVSNGAWTFTSANLAAGSYTFSAIATDLAGNTTTAVDAGLTIAAQALTISYAFGVDTSSTTRTVSVTTPVAIASTGSDSITLAIAEDAYLGDAQFTVSVDGTQIGGVQTTTALHSQGLSQNFTLQGNFGAGPHTVSVDFLNDAAAIYSNGTLAGDRNLYVDSITGDGVTTVENVEENLSGTVNYKITLPSTGVKPTQVAPVVTLAATQSVAAGGTATLGTAVPGNSGDALSVKLISDADFSSGSSLVLSNGNLVYTPGTITSANAGTDTISYTVTDGTNGLATTETEKVTLVAPVVVKPTVSILSQVLAKDTGASSTDDITNDGVVTLTGAVTGATGTVVSIVDGSTTLGTATISNGQWTYSTTLAAGTHTLHAVATDPAGDVVTTSAEPTITVVAAPVVTINNPVEVTGTTEAALSGTVTDATQTSVQIIDASGVLGNATVSNGAWTFTSANLAAGSYTFSAIATDLAGNTTTAVDDGLTIAAQALTISYSYGVDTSSTTRTVSVTTPVTIASTGSDSITLAIAEDAYLGDAQFTVSVDGTQIGGVQTTTALHSQGLSQNFTLQGNFGAGPHTVSVDFLNDAAAIYSNGTLAGDRNLYVDSITGDGVTTVENVEENLSGTVNYKITLPSTVVKPTQVAPVVTLAATQSVASGGTATLGTAVPGNSGDALSVKLVSDADFSSGSSLALSNGNLVYTPGAITSGNAGTDTISYTVTDSTNGLATTETEKVTLTAPVVVKPTVSIISQVLAKDTGASSTDDITNDGVVTLTGAVTGATGTVVSIVDGSTTLGTATISNGQWTYSTTLAAGTHTLHAVATDPAGDVVTTSAEPTITVVTAAPALTIGTPTEVTGTTEVALSGTVTDATQTSVQISDASGVLGNATVSNGAWSFTTANLVAGSYTFSAVATDLAGNTTTATNGITLAAPVTTTPDEVLATVSTGTATTTEEVNLSSSTPVTGTYVPVSTSGIGTNPLVLYNWNPSTQLKSFLAAQAAGTASIVGIGDSFTDGFGSASSGWEQLSYLNEMSQVLKQDGIAAQSDNFLGSEFYITNGSVDDNRITPVGYPTTSTTYDGGFTIVAGGNAIYLNGAGKGFNFQLDTPGNYNEVTLSYIDVGSGSVSLTVDGQSVGNMTFGNTGETLTQTIKIPAGSHSDLVVKSTSANPVYLQGASFASTTNPAIQVYNAGIGGWDSSSADSSYYQGQTLKGSSNGFGQTASAAALHPSLALVDLGTNDIALGEDTTAQTLTNIEQIVATLQAAGTDVIIMIPQPFGSSAYATMLPALRSGLEAYSTANNVPLIDLSATYDNSEADLEAAGLKSDLLHGDATFYADIGSQLATLLSNTIASAASSGSNAKTTVLQVAATKVVAAVSASDNTIVTASASTSSTSMGFISTAATTATSTKVAAKPAATTLFAPIKDPATAGFSSSPGVTSLTPQENTAVSGSSLVAGAVSQSNTLVYGATVGQVSHSIA